MNHISRAIILSMILSILGSSSVFGQKEVELAIRETGYHRLDIIIGEFRGETVLGGDRPVFDILKQDLELSGYFRVLDGFELVSDWGDTGNIHEKWATIGADALVEGNVQRTGSQFEIEAFLSDLATGQLVTRRKVTGQEQRNLVHQVSDEVVKSLTGEKGIATTKVAFIWNEKGKWELCASDYDGRNVQRLTSTGSLKVGPAWSPTGELISYSSFETGDPDLFLWSVKERRSRRLTRFPGMVAGASWSADGRKIALTLTKDGNSEIYTMNSDGSRLRRVTRNPAIDCSPSWSPSGREIAFTSDRSGSPQIYVTDLDGTELRRLTFTGEYNESAAWSPKGDRIAYVAREAGFFDVWIMDPRGRHRRRITFKGTGNEDPAWAPDGRHLIYVSTRGYIEELVLTDLSGRLEYALPIGGGDKEEPTWSP
jgi:TolB protein